MSGIRTSDNTPSAFSRERICSASTPSEASSVVCPSALNISRRSSRLTAMSSTITSFIQCESPASSRLHPASFRQSSLRSWAELHCHRAQSTRKPLAVIRIRLVNAEERALAHIFRHPQRIVRLFGDRTKLLVYSHLRQQNRRQSGRKCTSVADRWFAAVSGLKGKRKDFSEPRRMPSNS